jgi:hypothetical protein
MTQPGFTTFQFKYEQKKNEKFSDLAGFVQWLHCTHIQEVVSSITGQDTG